MLHTAASNVYTGDLFFVTTIIALYISSYRHFNNKRHHYILYFYPVPSEWSKVDIRSLAPVQPTPQKEYVYVMSCTVTVVAGLTTLPVVQWMREDGSRVSNPDIVVGPSVVSGQRISLLLMIGQLTVDNMGTYICRADISVPGHKGILPISTPVNINEKILQVWYHCIQVIKSLPVMLPYHSIVTFMIHYYVLPHNFYAQETGSM